MALEYIMKLTEFFQEHPLVIANMLFQQHKRSLYTRTSPDGQYQNQIDYIFAAKDGEALYSQQKQSGTDCGSDHELLISKFRLKMKKIGKTTRPFRYDLNQSLMIQWKAQKIQGTKSDRQIA